MAPVVGDARRAAASDLPRLTWTAEAVADLAGHRRRIALDNPRAADRVALRVLDKTELLLAHPRLAPPGPIPGTRALTIGGTRLVVDYRVVGDEVVILSVKHGAQER